ncbi:MAG: InlB B-repeat-containing protein [Lachnospiraceae bacterium]|nr:InlB B-repeat-containing protein [Lachnospiraceae bacterium]
MAVLLALIIAVSVVQAYHISALAEEQDPQAETGAFSGTSQDSDTATDSPQESSTGTGATQESNAGTGATQESSAGDTEDTPSENSTETGASTNTDAVEELSPGNTSADDLQSGQDGSTLPDSAEIGTEAGAGIATEADAEAEIIIEAEDEIGPVSESDETDPEELFETYLEHTLYPEEPVVPGPRKNALRAIRLPERAQVLYNLIRPEMQAAADGHVSTAEFVFDLSVSLPSYTPEELGVETIVSEGVVSAEAREALKNAFMVDIRTAMNALQAQMPYVFYWFDKTSGWSASYAMSASSKSMKVSRLTLKMRVAAAYSVSGEKGTLEIDTTKTSAAKETAAYAVEVVEGAELVCNSDYDFIVYYTEWLCKETDYNHPAAANSTTPYGDPWQLIYAFDKDPETKIVCEGYAKAFKYLCDLTSFEDNNTDVLIVTGDMSSDVDVIPGSRGHMWNNVRMDDGATYLVDVTNCDMGKDAYGQDQWTLDLCLKGYRGTLTNAHGFSGYSFRREASTLYYYYYDDTRSMFSEEELAVSAEDYDPLEYATVTFDLNGGRFPSRVTNSEKLVCGDRLPAPEEPVRAGHVFLGWYRDPVLETEGQKYLFEDEPEGVTQTMTLYAHWSAVVTVAEPALWLYSDAPGDPDSTQINHNIIAGGTGMTQEGTVPAVRMGARIRMTSTTPDAHIYYRTYADSAAAYADAGKFDEFLAPYPTDGVPATDCLRYTEEIVLTPDMPGLSGPDAEGYRSLTIWAIAVKHGYANSGYAATTVRVYDEDAARDGTPDWGDVTEEDRTKYGYTNPSEIPKGIWIAGAEDRTYTGVAQTFPELRVYHNKTLLKLKTDYTVSYKNNVKAAASDSTKPPTVTVTGRGSYSGTHVKTFAILPLVLDDTNPAVTTTADALFGETGAHIILPWNGKVQKKKLSLTVKDPATGKTRTLKEGTDYTIIWKETTKKITSESTAEDRETYGVYTADAFKAPGKWFITVKGTGSCEGQRTWTLEILNTNPAKTGIGTTEDARTHVNALTVPAIPTQIFQNAVDGEGKRIATGKAFVYAPEGSTAAGGFDGKIQQMLLNTDGSEFVWNITDKNAAETDGTKPYRLRYGEDGDYVLQYEANAAVGTAKVIIIGKGKYAGTRTVTFKIKGASMQNVNVLFDATKLAGYDEKLKGLPYTGLPYEVVGAAKKSGADPEPDTIVNAQLVNKSTKEVLARGTDFTVTYSNNTSPGTAEILFKGIGAYSGTVKKTFAIKAHSLVSDAAAASQRITLYWETEESQEWKADGTNDPVYSYAKGGVTPSPVLKYVYTDPEDPSVILYERTLEKGKDYTLTYKNNNVVRNSTDKNPPTVVIRGKGNFTGTVTRTFTTGQKSISDCAVTLPDMVYSARAGKFKSSPKVIDVNGNVLKAGTDYIKVADYYYASTTELANGIIREEGHLAEATDVVPAGTILRVTVTGKGNYSGTAEGYYRVIQGDLSKATVRIEPQYYTGKEVRLTKRDITVISGGVQLSDSDYEIVSYKNNIQKGKAYVTLRGTGAYGNAKTASFSIVQRPVGFVIRFEGNRATAGSMKQMTSAPGKDVKLTKNAFKRIGYSFQGWNTKVDGSGDAYDNLALYTVPENAAGSYLTLYAQWEPVPYTITWHTQGGPNHPDNEARTGYDATQSVFTVKAPAEESWPKGFRFGGWYTSANYKTPVTQIQPAKGGNLQIYAKWIPYTYRVIFDGNEATSGSMKEQILSYGIEQTLSSNTFKRTGYVFAGWSAVPYDSIYQTATWPNKAKAFNLVKPRNDYSGTITLYAVWHKTATAASATGTAPGSTAMQLTGLYPHILRYELNGGTFLADVQGYLDTMPGSGTAHHVLPVPQKDGYVFDGWFKDARFGTRVTTVSAYTGVNMTLYAKWKATDQKDIANAQITIAPQKYTGSPVKLTNRDVLVRFTDGGTTTILDDSSYEILEDSYLYNVEDSVNTAPGAVVSRARVTIRGKGKYKGTQMVYFDISGNAIGYRVSYDHNRTYLEEKYPLMPEEVMPTGTMPQGETVVSGTRLLPNAYTAAWFTFTGWNTEPDGSGIAYDDREILCNKEGKPLAETDGTQVTLYAQWEASFAVSELTGLPVAKSLENQRPIAVMIDNEKVALPHYGMSEADVVYEMINSTANNRVTRYMALYKDWKNIPRIGNVRSTRPTNALLFPEWNAVLFHEGAPYVHTNAYFNNDYTPHVDGGFSRIANGKAYEFTSFVTKGQPAARMKAAKIPETYTGYPKHNQPREHYLFVPYGTQIDLSQKYDGVVNATGVDLSGVFPKNEPALQYDAARGVYRYSEYGSVHRDAEDNAALEFKNVFLQRVSFNQLDENGYLIYNVLHADIWTDVREGWYLTNGKAVPVIWYKAAATGYTRYFILNKHGVPVEINVNPGKTYIALVPDDTWDKLKIQ